MLGEDRAAGEMAEGPSDDPTDHQLVETVPLGEVAADMEMGLGEVPPGPRLETAVTIHLMAATGIHSSIAYSMSPRTEMMLMDLARFSQSRYQYGQIIRN